MHRARVTRHGDPDAVIGMNRMPVEERFHRQYQINPKTGCWDWTGKLSFGYGRLQYQGAAQLAHRVSWELHHGPILPGMVICHACDNRACVNPEHLLMGSQRANLIDGIQKGRLTQLSTGLC